MSSNKAVKSAHLLALTAIASYFYLKNSKFKWQSQVSKSSVSDCFVAFTSFKVDNKQQEKVVCGQRNTTRQALRNLPIRRPGHYKRESWLLSAQQLWRDTHAQLIKSFAFVGALALVLSVCSANYLSTLSNVNIDTRSDCGQTFWDWVTGSGCSAEAPVQQYRPEDRPQVVCTSWCPGGYTRREVSIGPDCSWYHIGKCVDRSGYYGESCGFAARTCIPGVELSCQPATQEDANKNAHSEACYFEPWSNTLGS